MNTTNKHGKNSKCLDAMLEYLRTRQNQIIAKRVARTSGPNGTCAIGWGAALPAMRSIDGMLQRQDPFNFGDGFCRVHRPAHAHQFFRTHLFGMLISIFGILLNIICTQAVYGETLSVVSTPTPSLKALKHLTLSDAIWLSLRYNPNVENAEINRVVQKYGVAVANNQFELQYALTGSTTSSYTRTAPTSSHSNTTTLTPTVSLNVPSGGSVNMNMTNTLNGQSTGGTYNPALSLSYTQPLMRGFGQAVTLSTLANAYDTERINQLTLKQTIMTTIVTVATDFYAVIQNQQNVTTQKMALDTAKERISQDNIKIKAGKMAPNDDRLQAQADLAQAALAYTSAENTLLQSKLTLLSAIGLSPDEPVEVDSHISLPPFQLPPVETVKKSTVENDPTYQTDLINLGIAKRAYLVAKDNARPQLNLTVSGTTGSASGSGDAANFPSLTDGSAQSRSIGLSLSVPIDDMPLQQAILTAKAQVKQDEIGIRIQKWTLETNAINGVNNLITLKQQLDLARDSVQTQTKVLNLTKLKQNFGLASALDVSLQQNALTTALLDYTTTEINYLTTWMQFRELIGATLEDWDVKVRY